MYKIKGGTTINFLIVWRHTTLTPPVTNCHTSLDPPPERDVIYGRPLWCWCVIKQTTTTTSETSDVNKDLGFKAKDLGFKAKDLSFKAKDLSFKAKAKDLSFKAKDLTFYQGQGLDILSRPRTQNLVLKDFKDKDLNI